MYTSKNYYITLDEFIKLLNKDYSVSYIDNNGHNILHIIARENRIDVLEKIMEHKPNLNVKTFDQEENTPLHFATHNAHHDMVKSLIKNGADPNILNLENESCIFDACVSGNYKIVEDLIKLNVKINHQNIYGSTPLHMAVEYHNPDIVKLLLNNNCNVNIQNYKGLTPIFYAVINGDEDIINLLLDKSNIFLITKKNDTLLHYVCDYERLDFVEKLMDRGLSPFTENKFGITSFDILKDNGNMEIIDKIIKIINNSMDNINHTIFNIQGIKDLVISYLCD